MGVQRIALEDHRDVAALRRQPVDNATADSHDALTDLLETGDHPKRSRLSAAGRADQHHELAVDDVEIETVDGLGAVTEDLRDCFEHNACHD